MLPAETKDVTVSEGGRRRGSFTVYEFLWRDMERLAGKDNRKTNNYFELFLLKHLPEALQEAGLEVGPEYDEYK